jgi:adenylyltransferase/sulfurtransferase
MILPDFGPAAQERLIGARALIVGCGALGCAVADFLARAGVGHLTIVDRDVVELTNLQRQVLFEERDARENAAKADAAARRLARVNSTVRVTPIVADFTHRNAETLLGEGAPGVGVLIDGTDNLGTRYLLNDLGVKHGIPFVYAGAVATRAMSATFRPSQGTACLRCLFPDLPADPVLLTCDTAGILGPVASIAAAFEAVETIKLLIGRPDLASTDLLELDPWDNRERRISIAGARNPDCPCCAQRRFEFLAGAFAQDVSVICTRNNGGAVQISPPAPRDIDLAALASRLASQGEFSVTDQHIRGVLTHETGDGAFPIELTVFRDGRTIVRGTTEPSAARAIHARYLGA